MTKELTRKIIRCLIVGLIFLGIVSIPGIKPREAQELVFSLTIMVMMGFLLGNVWLTMFLGWTIFLFTFFKFQMGSIYINNVFIGCLLYFLTKVSFSKKDIDFFIKAVLWFVFANICFLALQQLNFDFVFNHDNGSIARQTGLVGNIGFVGWLMALTMPLLLTRSNKWADLACFGLILPLWRADAAQCVVMAVIGSLFVLFFRLKRKIWAGAVIVLVLFGLLYTCKIDPLTKGASVRFPHWKKVLKTAVKKPITGWGLDSYANIKYVAPKVDASTIYWDNPHNLYISLFFEFGIVGLFLLGGYLRQLFIKFRSAEKSQNSIALMGFFIVFLGISFGHFPMFLARFAVILIPAIALLEIQIQEKYV